MHRDLPRRTQVSLAKFDPTWIMKCGIYVIFSVVGGEALIVELVLDSVATRSDVDLAVGVRLLHPLLPYDSVVVLIFVGCLRKRHIILISLPSCWQLDRRIVDPITVVVLKRNQWRGWHQFSRLVAHFELLCQLR